MHNNKNKYSYFENDSFYLSAYLISEGLQLASVKNHAQIGKYIFCFYDNKNLQNKVSDFYSLSAYVKPQDYSNAEKTLRSIIYSKRNYEKDKPV